MGYSEARPYNYVFFCVVAGRLQSLKVVVRVALNAALEIALEVALEATLETALEISFGAALAVPRSATATWKRFQEILLAGEGRDMISDMQVTAVEKT